MCSIFVVKGCDILPTILKMSDASKLTPLSTFHELEKVFIDEQEARQNSAATISHYQRSFKKLYKFFEEFYGGDDVNIVFVESVDIWGDYLRWLRRQNLSQPTINTYLRDFKAALYFCMDRKLLPYKKYVIKQAPIPIKDTYTDAEIKKLLVKPNIDNFTYYRNWVIINYLLATGNRLNTIINLRVEDIDFDDSCVIIKVQKSGQITRIPLVRQMTRILREYIDAYRSDGGYLFPNQFGEKLTSGALQKSIANYNRSRGVNKTSIHLFRHTFAAEWIKSEGSTASLQKMLGHSSLNAVQHYLQIYGTELAPLAEEHSVLNKTTRQTLQRRK